MENKKPKLLNSSLFLENSDNYIVPALNESQQYLECVTYKITLAIRNLKKSIPNLTTDQITEIDELEKLFYYYERDLFQHNDNLATILNKMTHKLKIYIRHYEGKEVDAFKFKDLW